MRHGLVVLIGAAALAGCANAPSEPASLIGAWSMDLSPAQDGSYVQEMKIDSVDQAAADRRPAPITGSVYGGNGMEGGYAVKDGDRVVLTFVSDGAGVHGGPYYWVGWTRPDGTLAGGVRSVSRGLLMNWRATRNAAAEAPAATAATGE